MVRKEYVLTDIMRKRKKDQQAVDSKIRNKLAMKSKRKKNKDALKAPEKFIKQYRAQQKSYAHYRLKVKSRLLLRTERRRDWLPVAIREPRVGLGSCCWWYECEESPTSPNNRR